MDIARFPAIIAVTYLAYCLVHSIVKDRMDSRDSRFRTTSRHIDKHEKLKANEVALSDFRAFQQCPSCEAFGYYGFERKWWFRSNEVKRQCHHCGHAWKQG